MAATPTTTALQAFEEAFRARDFAPAAAVLAHDVAFRSPVLAEPWRTRPVLERLGPAMMGVFEDMVFAAPLAQGSRGIALFTARRDGVEAEGALVLEVGADGLVTDVAILVRPLPALIAVARAMGAAVDPALLAGHR
jgi:hypothetical protein